MLEFATVICMHICTQTLALHFAGVEPNIEAGCDYIRSMHKKYSWFSSYDWEGLVAALLELEHEESAAAVMDTLNELGHEMPEEEL